MLEAGAIILTVSSSFMFIAAAFTLALLLILKKNAPILPSILDPSDLSRLDPKVISAMNSYAVLFNACAASFSLLMIFIIWSGLITRQESAHFILLLAAGFGQIISFKADAIMGGKLKLLNATLSALFLIGIALAGYSIFFEGNLPLSF
jgi:hypothetical protein